MDGLDWIERYAWFGYFVGFTVHFFLIFADLDISSVLKMGVYTVCSLHIIHISFSAYLSADLLNSEGALNELGQLYTGVQTIHTQIITQPPTKSYQTVNGADNPTQGLVTTYAAFTGQNNSPPRWDILRGTSMYQLLALFAAFIGGSALVF